MKNILSVYDLKIDVAVATVGTTLSILFGGYDSLLGTLLIFIIADLVSGSCVGFFIKKAWNSEEMRNGLMRKLFIFLFLLIAVRLDILFNSTNVIRTCVMYFYVANECLSVLENMVKLGVPFPSFIKERMLQMKDSADKGVSDNGTNKEL